MSLNHLKYYKGNSSFRYLIFLAHYGMLQLLIKVLEKISGKTQEIDSIARKRIKLPSLMKK